MISIFTNSFVITFNAMLQLFLIAAAAGLLMRKKIITQEHLKVLSGITVQVLLPCLTFSNIIKNFQPGQLKIWPLIPLTAVLTVAFGLAISAVLFRRDLPAKKNLLALSAIQNAGYLILPLGQTIYPAAFDEFALYCFIYLLGLSPLLWSLGKYLVSFEEGKKLEPSQLFSPPFFANIVAVFLVFTHIRNFIPEVVVNSASLVGSATVPVATLVLGAVLGSIKLNIRPYWLDMAKVLLVKLFLTPLVTIIILRLTHFYIGYPMLCNLIVLQAAVAPAMSLILLVKHYGGEEDELSSILFVSYISCIITIPFWLAVWTTITG